MERSKKFYADFLGQKILFDFGDSVTFEGSFSLHRKDHFQNLIKKEPENFRIHARSNNMELYFESERLFELEKKLLDEKIDILHTIQRQPWGQQVLRFYDPDGYLVEVGEPMELVIYRLFMENRSAAEIAAATSMPVNLVENTIKTFHREENSAQVKNMKK